MKKIAMSVIATITFILMAAPGFTQQSGSMMGGQQGAMMQSGSGMSQMPMMQNMMGQMSDMMGQMTEMMKNTPNGDMKDMSMMMSNMSSQMMEMSKAMANGNVTEQMMTSMQGKMAQMQDNLSKMEKDK